MRIVHAPTEIAGQMGILVNGLRQWGIAANGYNWSRNYLKYGGGIISTDAYELTKLLDPLASHADIFHFHNGSSFLINNADLPLLTGKGKKVVMHHWGNDVRTDVRTSRLNPFPLPPSYMTDEKIHERLALLSRYIRHAIVQDHELLPHVTDYYEQVHLLPLACDANSIPYKYPEAGNPNPLVIHAPTDRKFKGSAYIETAVEDLRKKYKFTYTVVEKTSHQQAMRMYLSADIVVDQIMCGTYGMLSVEAMAMGKPVVAYIRDDLRRGFPATLPIVSATPDTIRDVLADLISDPERRHRIGKESRAYVEQYHALNSIIPKLLDIYHRVE